MKDSPCILVPMRYCYLPYDHMVRYLIRKLAWAERQRQRCKEAYNPTQRDQGQGGGG